MGKVAFIHVMQNLSIIKTVKDKTRRKKGKVSIIEEMKDKTKSQKRKFVHQKGDEGQKANKDETKCPSFLFPFPSTGFVEI